MRQTLPLLKNGNHLIKLLGLVIALTFALPGQAPAQERKESIAVLDLEGRGISAIEAATLTDRMRSELVKTGAVTVVERGQMQTILAEQDFQMAGCTSDECAVQIGQMLGVTMMYSGSIGKIGATYTVDVRGVSVETGAIENTMSRDYRGEIDGLIQEIEHLSWELVGLVHPDDILSQLGDTPSINLDDIRREAEREPEREAEEEREEVVQPKKKGGFSLMKMIIYAGILGGAGFAATMAGGEDEPTNGGGNGGADPIGEPPTFPNPN
ncbi:MAG: CsgG/HfaB family protein [Candidatus Neomarinimicrobiota bacterium]